MKKEHNLLILKALEFFVKNPYEKIHLREYGRKLKISPNTANRFLDLFLKNNFLIEEKEANLRYFKTNLNSLVFREIKKSFILNEIEKSGILEELKEISFQVVLFGSCAKGLDDKKSDLDFLVISKKKEEVKEIFYKYLNHFEKTLTYHIFSPLDWKKQKEENIAFYEDVISSSINLIGEIPI